MRWLAPGFMTLGLAACTPSAQGPDVSQAIGKLVREERVGTLRLADAAPFAWDQVYLFAPYTPRAAICQALRLAEPDCGKVVTAEPLDDGEMALAFVAQGRVVRHVRHLRHHGDFTPVPAAQPLAQADAVFEVVRRGNGANGAPWFHLRQR